MSLLEDLCYGNNAQLLDTEICVADIEDALKTLKLGESGDQDGLPPEHISLSLKVSLTGRKRAWLSLYTKGRE